MKATAVVLVLVALAMLMAGPLVLVLFVWVIIAPAVNQQIEDDPCSAYPGTTGPATGALTKPARTAAALPAPGQPRRASRNNPPITIPAAIRPLYVKAAARYNITWTLLAGVGMEETGHGRNTTTSTAGARGLMQFMPSTFAAYGVDGDGDGRKVITNDADNILSAAHYLSASGATRTDGVRKALFAYNRAGWYVNDVLFYAAHYAGTAPATTKDCAESTLGDMAVPPGPDGLCPASGSGAERGLTPNTLRMLRCVKKTFGWITSMGGVGPRPNVSDHPSGHAVDFIIPKWRTPAGNARGWQVARWLQGNATNLKIKYVIFDNKVWRAHAASRGWARYTHPNGNTNPTLKHEDHVHASTH